MWTRGPVEKCRHKVTNLPAEVLRHAGRDTKASENFIFLLLFSLCLCALVANTGFSSGLLVSLALLFVLCGSTVVAKTTSKPTVAKGTKSDTTSTIDSKLVGVWGVDARGGYDFRADGTFSMQGAVTYHSDAANGVWHYWQPSMPNAKVTAEYRVSGDGKSLSINLKKGKPFTNLTKIK